MTFAKYIYRLPGTFVGFAGLISSLPAAYAAVGKGKRPYYIRSKEIIVTPFISDQIRYLLGTKEGKKHFYNRLIQHTNTNKHWENKHGERY